jgi:hypothetical protein
MVTWLDHVLQLQLKTVGLAGSVTPAQNTSFCPNPITKPLPRPSAGKRMGRRKDNDFYYFMKTHKKYEEYYHFENMTKKKIAISLDDNLLDLIDEQRGGEKRSTYINSILGTHFKAMPEDTGGGTFVTTLELRKTLKPIYDKLVIMEGLYHDVKTLQEILSIKKNSKE